MHKQELAKSRTTENRAINSILNEQVNEWVVKIREAGKVGDGGVRGTVTRTAYVLLDLINLTERGEVPREVISETVKRVNVQASLAEAQTLRRRSS